MRLIPSIAREISEWVSRHQGRQPTEVRVPQALIDCLEDEAKYWGLRPKEHPEMGGEVKIHGIPIRADYKGSTIGRIVP